VKRVLSLWLLTFGFAMGACAVNNGVLEEDTPARLSEGPGEARSKNARDEGERVRAEEAACRASPGPTRIEQVCHAWKCGMREGRDPSPWDGDPVACSPGRADFGSAERALRLVNLHRALAGVPPVTLEPAWTSAAQECALLAHANEALSHEPPPEWRCWSDLAAYTSQVSLLANRSGPPSIAAYMEDPGNESSMVHRRWLLTERLVSIGVGSTNRFSCLVVDGRGLDVRSGASRAYVSKSDPEGSASPSRAWVAWPPAGPIPIDVFSTERLDETGWTVQSSSAALDTSTVRISSKGQPLPVKTTHLTPLLGSRSAIGFIPDGWKTAPGEAYEVHVEGPEPFEFTVEPVACP
jgi:hypothetical protein